MFFILLMLGIAAVPMIWSVLAYTPSAAEQKRLAKRKAYLLKKKDRITYWQEFHSWKFELAISGAIIGIPLIAGIYFL
jgi:hypothetical protein